MGSESSQSPEASFPLLVDGPPDSPLAVDSEWRGVMGTSPAGRGFPIIMGILGTLLVIILLLCIFYAIFRDGQMSNTYSSQYSSPDGGYGSTSTEKGVGGVNVGTGNNGTSMFSGHLPGTVNEGGVAGSGSTQMTEASAQESRRTVTRVGSNEDENILASNPFADYSKNTDRGEPRVFGAMTGYESVSNDDIHGYPNGGDAPHHILQNQMGVGDTKDYAMDYQYLQDTRHETFMPITENITANLTQTEAISHVDDHIGFTGAYCANDIVDKALSEEMLEEEKLRNRIQSEETLGGDHWRIENSMRQTLHANSNVVHEQGYVGYEENSFDKIGCRIAQSLGDRNVHMCGPEVEVAGVDISHEGGCASNPPPDAGMYSSNGSNPAPTPYEQDIVLNGASGSGYCQETNHEGKFDTSRRFIVNREEDGTRESRSRASTEEPWPAWWSRDKMRGAVSSGEFRGNLVDDRNLEGCPEEYGDTIGQERDDENMKENSSANSNSLRVDTQGPNDNWVDRPDENDSNNGIWKGREGLTATGRLLDDNEWRRDYDRERTSAVGRELDPEYDYLRERREPYVKVVANRLSSGVPAGSLDIDYEQWTG